MDIIHRNFALNATEDQISKRQQVSKQEDLLYGDPSIREKSLSKTRFTYIIFQEKIDKAIKNSVSWGRHFKKAINKFLKNADIVSEKFPDVESPDNEGERSKEILWANRVTEKWRRKCHPTV